MSSANVAIDQLLIQPLIQSITAGVESLVSHTLQYDPASQQKISALTDILAIELSSPEATVYLRGQTDGIAIFNHCESPVSTHIKGSAISLLSLLKPNANLAKSGVSVVGNTQLLQQWQSVLQQLDIDWEEAISQIIGDIAGPIASQQLHNVFHWASSQAKEQQRLMGEYLTEELKLIPTQAETDRLAERITKTQMDMDRLAAKVQRLKKTVDAYHKDSI